MIISGAEDEATLVMHRRRESRPAGHDPPASLITQEADYTEGITASTSISISISGFARPATIRPVWHG